MTAKHSSFMLEEGSGVAPGLARRTHIHTTNGGGRLESPHFPLQLAPSITFILASSAFFTVSRLVSEFANPSSVCWFGPEATSIHVNFQKDTREEIRTSRAREDPI